MTFIQISTPNLSTLPTSYVELVEYSIDYLNSQVNSPPNFQTQSSIEKGGKY